MDMGGGGIGGGLHWAEGWCRMCLVWGNEGRQEQ